MTEALLNIVLKYFTRSFLVTSLLPMVIAVLTFLFLFPAFELSLLATPLSQLVSLSLLQLLVPLVIVYWLAFILQNNFNIVLKFYKGAFLPKLISTLMIRLQRSRLRKQAHYTKRLFEILKNQSPSEMSMEEIFEFADLRERALSESIQIGGLAMLRDENISPTSLGNTFKAIDYYPLERYGIQNSVIWPKLYPLIPQELKNNLKEVFDNMFFFLNSSILANILSLSAFVFVIFSGAREFGDGVGLVVNMGGSVTQNMLWLLGQFYKGVIQNDLYLIASLILLVAGYLLYKFAIAVLNDYEYVVRSVYDLHRFELLRGMNMPIPRTLQEEKNLWERINEFLGVGDSFGFQPLEIHYAVPIDDQIRQSISWSRAKPRKIKKRSTKGNRGANSSDNPSQYTDVFNEIKSETKNTQTSNTVHLDLGGVTLDAGDLLKKSPKASKTTSTPKKKRTKKSPVRKASQKPAKGSRKKTVTKKKPTK